MMVQRGCCGLLLVSACVASTSGDAASSSSGTMGASSEGDGAVVSSSGEGSQGASGEGTSAGAVTELTTGVEGTSDGSSNSESSTGEVLAVCGDGVVQDGEECDDGNEDAEDGCSETCAADVRVFVTSELYKAGELMGPYLADAICLNRADDAGLANPQRFKAWLSSSEEDARDRFNRERRGRLVMINGLVFAAAWEALLAGQLENPLEVTEIGTTYHGPVWTGTAADGTAMDGSDHCLDWTTISVMSAGYYGYSDEISFEWTIADQGDNPLPCFPPLAIYCFENF